MSASTFLACTTDVVLGVRDVGSDAPVALGATADIVAGAEHTCVLDAAGDVRCWGGSGLGQTGTGSLGVVHSPVLVASSIRAIGAGAAHTCAVDRGDRVRCWGDNRHGEFGDGTMVSSSLPTSGTLLPGARHVAGGAEHTCASTERGSVYCWGSANAGQLGDPACARAGDPGCAAHLAPFEVPGITDAIDVAAGIDSTCALHASGAISCWGTLGASASNVPRVLAGVTDAVAFALRLQHACALRAGGEVVCWGIGESGELGTGATLTFAATPVVSSLGPASAISAGNRSSCAVTPVGVHCVGENGAGQLTGTSGPQVLTPAPAPLDGAIALAQGNTHTCALLNGDGSFVCIGSDVRGQLGDGP